MSFPLRILPVLFGMLLLCGLSCQDKPADNSNSGTATSQSATQKGPETSQTPSPETSAPATQDNAAKGGDKTATAETISAELKAPRLLAVDATHLYWLDQDGEGSLWSLVKHAKDGSEHSFPVKGIESPSALLLDDTHVYIVHAKGLGRAPKAGGSELEAMYEGPVSAATLSKTHVYAFMYEEIHQRSKDKNDDVVIASDVPTLVDLFVTDTHVIWLTTDSGGLLIRSPLKGGEPETLAKGLGNAINAPQAQGDHVYFSNAQWNLFRLNLSAPGQPEPIQGSGTRPLTVNFIAAGPKHFAWLDGHILHARPIDGSKDSIVKYEVEPKLFNAAVVLDDTHAYLFQPVKDRPTHQLVRVPL